MQCAINKDCQADIHLGTVDPVYYNSLVLESKDCFDTPNFLVVLHFTKIKCKQDHQQIIKSVAKVVTIALTDGKKNPKDSHHK